jgi:hypothetical protein
MTAGAISNVEVAPNAFIKDQPLSKWISPCVPSSRSCRPLPHIPDWFIKRAQDLRAQD